MTNNIRVINHAQVTDSLQVTHNGDVDKHLSMRSERRCEGKGEKGGRKVKRKGRYREKHKGIGRTWKISKKEGGKSLNYTAIKIQRQGGDNTHVSTAGR